MKKTLLIILLGFISVACKEEKKTEIIIDAKKIEDSINKVREQEVLNLNVDDSKLFDTIVKDVK